MVDEKEPCCSFCGATNNTPGAMLIQSQVDHNIICSLCVKSFSVQIDDAPEGVVKVGVFRKVGGK